MGRIMSRTATRRPTHGPNVKYDAAAGLEDKVEVVTRPAKLKTEELLVLVPRKRESETIQNTEIKTST